MIIAPHQPFQKMLTLQSSVAVWPELARHTKVAPVAIAKLHAALGAEAAVELAAFIKTVVYEMKACAELENIDCDLFFTRSFDVFMDEAYYNDTEQYLKRLRNEGVE